MMDRRFGSRRPAWITTILNLCPLKHGESRTNNVLEKLNDPRVRVATVLDLTEGYFSLDILSSDAGSD